MSIPTVIGQVSSSQALMTTELNSLANNALVISSVNGTSGVFANVSGSGTGGYLYGRLVLFLSTFGSAPTANSAIDVWFLVSADGTNYESGSASITPARPPDYSFPVIAQTAAQYVNGIVPLPITANYKVLVRNNATGQSLAATLNTLTLYPTTDVIPSI